MIRMKRVEKGVETQHLKDTRIGLAEM